MSSARSKLISLVILSTLLFGLTYVGDVRADGSCTATVSPTSVQANTGTDFAFTLTNTGDAPVTVLKIEAPSENFSLENHGVSGWSVSGNSYFAELSGGSVAGGATAQISYFARTGASEAPSADWYVSTNNGTGFVYCTGSLGTAIVGAADITAPEITNIGVSSITSTTAKITWTTDEASSSSVTYNSDTGGSGELGGNSNTTSHEVPIGGLKPSTTYYYFVVSVDSLGNRRQSIENNFTTALTTVTSATATPGPVVVTVTATPAPGATAAPIASDKTPPTVSITTEFSEPFETAPTIEGKASDNKGIRHIYYSTDGGKNWLPVDEMGEEGSSSSEFKFTPLLIEDGNYEIRVKAEDINGNEGLSAVKTLVIDRLPPRVGGNLLSMGPLALLPNSDGVIITMAGIEMRITLSAVGGPTSIDLFTGNQMSSLGFSPEIGLWTGALNLKIPGIYQLKTKAVDGAGNKTEREINTVAVLEPGKVKDIDGKPLKNAEVTVYVQDSITMTWSLWDAKTFGQENPYKVGDDGSYQFFLPPGTYYLTIKVFGKGAMTTNIFTLSEVTPFNANFTFITPKSINLGFINFPLPSIFSEKADVVLVSPTLPKSKVVSDIEGKDAPNFILNATNGKFDSNSLNGQKSVITFINTWSPPSIEQLSVFDNYEAHHANPVAIISSQEAESKITVFQKRGGYKVPLITDRDGELVESYNLTSTPAHYFLNSRGIISKVVTGVLTEDEIVSILLQIE